MRGTNEFRPWDLFPSWLDISESEEWMKQINKNLIWDQPVVTVFGSSYLVPRMTNFIAEKDISYSYSGFVHHGKGWPDWFYPLLEMVNSVSGVKYNGCLLNSYRNGNDRMGWHADNESELDLVKPISSLSLGATRDFALKHRNKKLRATLSLKTGDLLIMQPTCQQEWLHSVPTRKKISNQRINLTFRCYK